MDQAPQGFSQHGTQHGQTQNHTPQGIGQPGQPHNNHPQGIGQPGQPHNNHPQGIGQPGQPHNNHPQGIGQPGQPHNNHPQGIGHPRQPQQPTQHGNLQQTFQVFVKNYNDSQTYTFDVRNTTTVEELKNMIRNKLPGQIPNEQQRLIFAGHNLDKGTLKEYDIQANSTIFLQGRLRGGYIQ